MAKLPLWFKATADLPEKRVFGRDPDLRLWLWLLAKAKKADDHGRVRFSYAKVCDDLSVMVGSKRVRPTRKQVRSALLRLARDGNVTGTEGAQRRVQGGVQGYFVVSVCGWGTWYDSKSEMGTGTGTRRATDGHETGTVNPDPESEGSRGSVFDQSREGLDQPPVGADQPPADVEGFLLQVGPTPVVLRKRVGSGALLGPGEYLRLAWSADLISSDRYAELLSAGVATPGALLAQLDPLAFNSLTDRVRRNIGAAKSRDGYARSSLAKAWRRCLRAKEAGGAA